MMDSDYIAYKTLYWEVGSYTDPDDFPPTVCLIRDLGQSPTGKVHKNRKDTRDGPGTGIEPDVGRTDNREIGIC